MASNKQLSIIVTTAIVVIVALGVVLVPGLRSKASVSVTADAKTPTASAKVVTVRWRSGIRFQKDALLSTVSTIEELSSEPVVFTVNQTERTTDDPEDPNRIAAVSVDLGNNLHVCLRIFAVGDLFDRGSLEIAGEVQGNWQPLRSAEAATDEGQHAPVSAKLGPLAPQRELTIWDSAYLGGEQQLKYEAYNEFEILGEGIDVPEARDPLLFGPQKTCVEMFGLAVLNRPEEPKQDVESGD